MREKQGEHLTNDRQQLEALTCWVSVQLCPWPALTTLWAALQTNSGGDRAVTILSYVSTVDEGEFFTFPPSNPYRVWTHSKGSTHTYINVCRRSAKVAEPPACISEPDKAHLGLLVMKGVYSPVPLSFMKALWQRRVIHLGGA